MTAHAESLGARIDDPVVTRPTRTASWNLVRNGTSVASAYAVCRPDRRWFVSIDTWDEHDNDPLVHAMIADLRHDLHTRIDGGDPRTLEIWSRYAFEPERREIEFVISPGPQRTKLVHCLVPEGIALLPADDVDETELRRLDERIRDEIPGTGGWINDPTEFHDYTFDEKHFDPATYLVAVDAVQQQFAGLVRIWANDTRARLGLIGVARHYRRRGLARALLASAFRPLHDRGIREVLAEVDASNVASLALLRSLDAVETGSSVVLRRRVS